MKPVKFKLTKAEVRSFNAFTDERMMAFDSVRPKPILSEDQLSHLRACFFNAISDAYHSGMCTASRKLKPTALGIPQLLKEVKTAVAASTRKEICSLEKRIIALQKGLKK